VRWGRPYARAQFAASLLLAFAVPVVFSSRGYGPWVLLPLALLPWAWRHALRLKRDTTAAGQIALLADTGKFLAAYAVLLAIGIW
jgi:1,4-dihydroxy-2-naphthoate octaprenyltransferase